MADPYYPLGDLVGRPQTDPRPSPWNPIGRPGTDPRLPLTLLGEPYRFPDIEEMYLSPDSAPPWFPPAPQPYDFPAVRELYAQPPVTPRPMPGYPSPPFGPPPPVAGMDRPMSGGVPFPFRTGFPGYRGGLPTPPAQPGANAVRGFDLPGVRFNWPGGLSWSWPQTAPTSPVPPSPVPMDAIYGPPAPPAQAAPLVPPPDIGPGIPIAPDVPVTSMDISGEPVTSPNAPPQQGFWQRLAAQQNQAAPRPLPPQLNRPDFIYTNPAAAQQAAASLQARLGYQTAQDQGYRNYLIAQQNAELARQTQQQRLAENALDRGLQREGFASSERSAALRGAYDPYDARNVARQKELADNRYIVAKENYTRAKNLVDFLNNTAMSEFEKRKLAAAAGGQGWLTERNGKYVLALPDPDLAAPGVQSLDDVRARLGAANDAGRANLGLPTTPPPAAPPAPGPVAPR